MSHQPSPTAGKRPGIPGKGLIDGVRDYTGGFKSRDFKRLFDEDAADAYTVLARDQRRSPEPPSGLPRLLYRLRTLFLGFSYRLSPARRILFALSLLFALFGVADFGLVFDLRGRVVIDSSPVWFIFSVAGLTLLLGLELVEQVRVRDELEVARQLQRDLLPAEAPELAGYRICHAYRTANEVGGDYYDFRRLEDGRMAVMVGDASGHGMAAGLLMAIANATLKLAIDLDPSPVAVLQLLNRSLWRTGDNRAFMSLFYCRLDAESGELEYATAGHPFPLLRRRNGEVTELGEGGLPLGLRAEVAIPSGSARLERGDLLVLYSDGLPEATDEKGESFGYQRLTALVEDAPTPDLVLDRILASFDRHLGGRALEDDFSLVIVGRDVPLPPLPQT